jgi:hypothetical protein
MIIAVNTLLILLAFAFMTGMITAFIIVAQAGGRQPR